MVVHQDERRNDLRGTGQLVMEEGRRPMNLSTGKYWDKPWCSVVGCSPCSEGCAHCWAADMARRQDYSDLVTDGHWNGQVRFREKVLEDPIHWRKPCVVAVCWMGDLFHEKVPDEWIDRVFAVMALCPKHTFLVLTKRPQRMAVYLQKRSDRYWHWRSAKFNVPWPETEHDRILDWLGAGIAGNVWLGTSAENQEMLDQRLPKLFKCGPGWKYWASLEPLLGPVDVRLYLPCVACGRTGWDGPPSDVMTRRLCGECNGHPFRKGTILSGVVLGGETGSEARPMDPDWAQKVRDDCAASGTSCFFKGWGTQVPASQCRMEAYGHEFRGASSVDDSRTFLHLPKKDAGRLLDGQEHNELPWG